MISQPTNIIPSTLSGTGSGVVDVTNGLDVKWQFSGSPMTAYKIDIAQNDALSTLVYSTGKIAVSPAFSPTDNKGNVQTFEADTISAATLASVGIVNGYENGYKITITQWDGTGDVSSYSATGTVSGVTISKPTWSGAITEDGSYHFEYDGMDWMYNGSSVSLSTYGISASGTPASGDAIDVSYVVGIATATAKGDIYDVAVDETTWKAKVSANGTYVFSYDGTNWKLSGSNVTISEYGISFSGTAANGDVITVEYTVGETAFVSPKIDVSVVAGIESASIDVNTWESQVSETGKYNIIYDGTNWLYSGSTINLADCGITITGTPASGNTITVDYQAGSLTYTAVGSLVGITANIPTIEQKFPFSGKYTFEYRDANTETDELAGWYYNGMYVSLSDYGISVSKTPSAGDKFSITLVSGCTKQLSSSVFITRSTPTVAITPIANPYTTRSIDITATYQQAQGDTLAWVEWFLRNEADTDNMLVDTGFLYTNLLSLSYDGLLDGNTYSVRLVVQTENGVQADTGWVSFAVSYPTADSEGLVTVCRQLNAPYVQISWINRTVLEGWINEGYTETYGDGILRLPAGAIATWDSTSDVPLSFAKPWSFAWRGQRTDITGGLDVWELQTEGESVVLNVTPTGATLKQGDTVLYTRSFTLKANDWLVCALTPTHFYLKQVTYTGGLFPATDLYPDTTLYPTPISQVINVWDAEVSYTQDNVSAIKLNGQQNCDYIWLYSGTLTETTIDNLMGGSWYEPMYDAQTFLIATFNDRNLVADVNGGNGDSLYGASIYRQASNEKILRHIADLSQDFLVFRDYGVKSRTTYVYYVFLRGQETYVAAPYVSNPVTPQFGTYTLMECELQDDGFYHVLQSFIVAGNVDAGSISNNSNVSVLQNFTRYPIVQPSSLNYKSGTLTALIGDCSNNSYSDTWELADKIMALSTSTNPKFLRDAKGALWQIDVNGSISMTVNDRSAVIPIQMSFPWVEVADAKQASIILLPSDDLWEKDNLYLTSVDVDIDDGCLYWSVPDGYEGSSLVLSTEGNLLEIGTGFLQVLDATITNDGYLTVVV